MHGARQEVALRGLRGWDWAACGVGLGSVGLEEEEEEEENFHSRSLAGRAGVGFTHLRGKSSKKMGISFLKTVFQKHGLKII